MKNVFSERFKKERERARLTQDDIAEACKNRDGESLSRAAIAQWEDPTGTKPGFENLVAAATRMGASIDYLVGLSDSPYVEKTRFSRGVGEERGEYRSLSDNAIRLAKQWQRLSPHAQNTIQDLIDLLNKPADNKR